MAKFINSVRQLRLQEDRVYSLILLANKGINGLNFIACPTKVIGMKASATTVLVLKLQLSKYILLKKA